jgi:hypothetical protein
VSAPCQPAKSPSVFKRQYSFSSHRISELSRIEDRRSMME